MITFWLKSISIVITIVVLRIEQHHSSLDVMAILSAMRQKISEGTVQVTYLGG
jgi:hypothetical protein